MPMHGFYMVKHLYDCGITYVSRLFAGVNLIFRKAGCYITTYEKISRSGDEWEVLMTSSFHSDGVKFTIGKEFDEVTPDGRKFKASYWLSTPNYFYELTLSTL